MFYFRCYIFFLSLFLLTLVSKAQMPFISEKSLDANTNYVVESWNSENGLPQNTVMRVFQSKDGFLWIATFNGLLRYDGEAMKLFNTLNTPGLPNNSIRKIEEDKNGFLWFVTIDGKLIKYYKGDFETISINSDPDITVEDICENEKGELLVATGQNKIYNLKGQHFSLLVQIPSDSIKLTKIQYSLPDSSLNIGTTKGLYRYKDHELSLVSKIKGKVSIIKKGPNNNLWIFANSLLFYIENGICYEYKLPSNIKEQGGVTDFLVEKKEKIWLSTRKGVVLSESGNLSYYDFTTGLSSNNTTNLFKDREGNIWVGTNDAGLNKLKLKTFKTYSSEEGLLSNVVGGIIQKKDNSILIENFCQGITSFKDEKFSPFKTNDIGCVWSMMEDQEGNLWIGTYGNWIYRYKNGSVDHFQLNADPANNVVFGLFQDKDGTIWIGTDGGMYTFKNEKFSSFGNKTVIGSVRYITQDKKGRILFGSKNGLGIIEDGKVEMYNTKQGLSHNEIRFVYEDGEGVLWVATYGGGINRFKDEKFFAFNQSKNFMDDFTSVILEDDDENFWVSTDHGIYSMKRSDLNKYADGETLFLNTIHYGKEDGLKNSECTGGFQSAGLKNSDGSFWFPTLAGVAIVHPEKNSRINNIPELVIESILVDENKLISNDSTFEISRNIKKIEFRYTAPYFTESKNILFQYKLDGKDVEWSSPTKLRFASYLGLPPGNYVFRVRIYGSVNTNINKEKTFVFNIPFPFWKTLPFYVILSTILLMMFLLFNYIRINNIRKKEEEKTEINKNYAALELKALQGQINPHFIFNCLNSITLFIATDNKAAASKYLGKFSKLIRLFLENSTSSTMRLSDVINLISLYIELEQLRLDHSFVFNLDIEPGLDSESITIPTMLLQPYVENAIHHGLWPKEKDGVLTITIKTFNERLLISIEDNGVGRNYSYEIKKNLIENRKSIGMSNTEERVKIINYLKNTDIKVNYVDKFNSKNEPTGTLVNISIPLI